MDEYKQLEKSSIKYLMEYGGSVLMRKIAWLGGGVVLLPIGLSGLSQALGMISAKSDAAVFFGWLFLVALLVGSVLYSLLGIKLLSPDSYQELRRRAPWMVLFIVAFSAIGSGCTRIEPGHVGIEVNLYGDDKGVSSYPQVTGMVWFNPMTTDILEYPTFVQTASWTKDVNEGSPVNEEISFNTKEGLVINADISLSYQLDSTKVPAFYVKFRSDKLDAFTHGFLRNVARDAFNEEGAKYAVEEAYGAKKEELLQAVRSRINKQVVEFGVDIQQFGFIGAPRLPQNVVGALNAKIEATQNAIRAENELRQAEAEAKKKVAQAEGEAKANAALVSSITPELIRWRELEISEKTVDKWDGKMPLYSGNAMPFVQLPSTK